MDVYAKLEYVRVYVDNMVIVIMVIIIDLIVAIPFYVDVYTMLSQYSAALSIL